MVDFKVDVPDAAIDEALKAALNAKILEALGESGRDRIVAEAVAYLTKPTKDYRFDLPVSPLMAMVFQSARDITESFIKKQFEGDTELANQVEQIYAEAMKRIFGVENREKLVEKLVKNFDKVIGDRY